MIWPLIPARLHGWLDDGVVLLYLAGAWLLRLRGAALGLALLGAAVHFTLARVTDYPQGQLKLISFRTHAFVELSEGIAVAAGGLLAAGFGPRAFLLLMGASQFAAFAISDYRWPVTLSGAPGR